MTDRCIATRLNEACAIEMIACFAADARLTSLYSDGMGSWRVHPWPFLKGEAATVPSSAARVYVLPTTYKTGTGGVNKTEYVARFCFVKDLTDLQFRPGDLSWYDDPMALRRWLYAGGTHPNRTGSIFDPDYSGLQGQHEFLTAALTEFVLHRLEAFPESRIYFEYDATWQVIEDSQGNVVG